MDEHEPDTTEKRIRFGCGAALGALVALPTAVWVSEATRNGTVLAMLATAVAFGWLAMRFGNRFWGWLRHWWL